MVDATLVSAENRMQFLPKFFGCNLMLVGEELVYNWMKRLSADYKKGEWRYYELSNGGFYMAPSTDTHMRVKVIGNYYFGNISSDAAGIVATMFALEYLALEFPSQDSFINLHNLLGDFILDHPESKEIFRALD